MESTNEEFRRQALTLVSEFETALNGKCNSELLCGLYTKLSNVNKLVEEEMPSDYVRLALNDIRAVYAQDSEKDPLYMTLLAFLEDVNNGFGGATPLNAVNFAGALVQNWELLIETFKYRRDVTSWRNKIVNVEVFIRKIKAREFLNSKIQTSLN